MATQIFLGNPSASVVEWIKNGGQQQSKSTIKNDYYDAAWAPGFAGGFAGVLMLKNNLTSYSINYDQSLTINSGQYETKMRYAGELTATSYAPAGVALNGEWVNQSTVEEDNIYYSDCGNINYQPNQTYIFSYR